MSSPRSPPLDGSVTVVPGLVDFHAKHNPDLPWVVFPSRCARDGVASVTFREFADATHKVAYAYRPQRSGCDGEVAAILLNCDVMHYIAVSCGLIRAGIQPFLISHRNSPEAIVDMMEKTGCHRVVTQESVLPHVRRVQDILSAKGWDVTVDDLVPLHDLFPSLLRSQDDGAHDAQPYLPPARPPQEDDVVYILHSSGSTGFPKPIPQKQVHVREWAACSFSIEGKNRGVRWATMHLPPFHAMGVIFTFLIPLMSGLAVAVYPPQYPEPPVVPSPENILEVCRATRCTAMISVPSMLEVWAQNPKDVKYLASLELVTFGGGPISQASGNKLISEGIKLCIVYGSTEAGSSIQGFDLDDSRGPDAPWRTSADWEWMKFADYVKPRWVPQGDGTYELHLLTWEKHHPAVENVPDAKGYNTSDMWVPHPTKEGYWRIVGRTDDVIVLGSGEKIVPIQQENHMLSSSMVSGTVMFGRARPQPGLLIEPSPEHRIDLNDEAALAAFRNKIWPVVEEANRLGPQFARVFKETIIVTNSSKPLPRAGKGTVQRKTCLNVYAQEIDKLYQTLADSTDAQGISPPNSWTSEDVVDWLGEHAASLNGGKAPPPSADVFSHGFDSLNATILRNRIIGGLRASGDPSAQNAAKNVSPNFIFDYPTLEQMASAVAGLVDPSSGSVVDEKDRAEHIVEYIEKYSANLPQRANDARRDLPDELSVLLTGSTGNLGSHIVAALLADPHIARVYTLDRPNSGSCSEDRLKHAFADRGLPLALLSNGKLRTLTGELHTEYFGLEPPTLDELLQSVTHVIHNAWKVNFNHALPSFEFQIAGSRRLVDFCAAAHYPARLLFTSSIGVALAQEWATPVPEAPLADPSVAVESGYSASKYVVEQLLHRAAPNGITSITLRTGQLCGSKTTGAWNTSDWVPILVKSSLAIGALPELEKTEAWIPMDTVAGAVLNLVLSRESPPDVLNVVHPRPARWTEVFGTINDALGAQLPFVPYAQWLAKLEALATNADNGQLEAVPALKLLEFFRRTGSAPDVVFATDQLRQSSQTLRDLGQIGSEHARQWVAYWRSQGYFE